MPVKGQVSELLRYMLLSSFFLQNPGPEQVYVAVTVSPAIAGISAEDIGEPADTNYARVPYGIVADNWQMLDLVTVGNSLPIVFPPISDDWGQLSGWAFCSAPAAGVVLAAGQLVEPVPVVVGMAPLSIDPLGIGIQLL